MSKIAGGMLHSKLVFSWGILLGLSAVPFVLIVKKVFPEADVLFKALMLTAGLVVAASLVGYLRPQKPEPTARADP